MLYEEEYLLVYVIPFKISLHERHELVPAQIDDSLRNVLRHMHQHDLSVVWSHMLVGEKRVVDPYRLLQR